jgi:cholesterol oxidase
MEQEWDYLVIGSGFGGSVSALRLVQKGYSVLLLEKGRRLRPKDFPKRNWNLKRWLWLPTLGCRGLFKMTFFPHLLALSGVGVGGGSLVYANTMPIPEDDFFTAPSWSHLANWKAELRPFYDRARKMLGVTQNPIERDPERILCQVARARDQEEHLSPTEVAVFFGEPGVTVDDPYFEGEGPARAGCTGCGACMVGCRHDGKNSLDKNYLYLAEQQGLHIEADTEATWVRPFNGCSYKYEVTARQRRSRWRRRTVRYVARNVVFSGGVLGTVPLLLRLKESPAGLPRLSDRVGNTVRTNSEALIAVTSRRRDIDLSQGLAIGAILRTDPRSHLELARYNAGSGFFRAMLVPHVTGRGALRRIGQFFAYAFRHPWRSLRAIFVPNWARYTTILLFMRTVDSVLRLKLGRAWTTLFRRGLITAREAGPPPTASIAEATELADQVARLVDGTPTSLVNESLLDVPTTAHVLGGCCMGETAEDGVIDRHHRVFNYKGLFVVDGSAVSANPGVNPSLTIAALAERAMGAIPERDQVTAEANGVIET